MYAQILSGSVWNPKNTKERKKTKKNNFLMFNFNVKNIKENQIESKFDIFLNFLVFI